ncbi:MAG: MFS transporter [Holophagales bacterium]|jgi:MFS family permease|nr:MFS transporter [Holophagales bacterium]
MSDTTTRQGFGRAFQIIWIFYFFSFVVSYALLATIPLHLRELGASVKISGYFTTAFMLGSGFGALFTGPLGDRWGQSMVLRWATIITASCFAMYALSNDKHLFFLIGIPQGVIWSGFRTATLAWVGGFLPEERRAEGLAFFGMAAPGGAALGPVLGIWLMPRVGFSWLMALLAVLSASLFLVLGRLPRIKEVSSASDEARSDPASNRNWILVPMVILLCLAISYGPIPSYGAQEAKDFDFLWTSALVSCYGFGMVALRLVLGWAGMGGNPIRLMPAMLAINVFAALGLALMPGGLIRHIFCGTLYGASFGMAHTLVWAYVMGRAEAGRRGAAVGTLYCAYDIGIALGSFLVGFPMEHLGYRWGWGAGAISLFIAWFFGRKIVKSNKIKSRSDL